MLVKMLKIEKKVWDRGPSARTALGGNGKGGRYYPSFRYHREGGGVG